MVGFLSGLCPLGGFVESQPLLKLQKLDWVLANRTGSGSAQVKLGWSDYRQQQVVKYYLDMCPLTNQMDDGATEV